MVKICLDYGHGGNDPGAVLGSRQEKDDVLRIGRMIRDRLRHFNIVVTETRSDDRFIGLSERAQIANSQGADYFISVHRNAGGGTGIESYLFTHTDKKTNDFAAAAHKGTHSLGFVDRGIKRANFAVLRETAMPAILMELGFIDNERDNSLFDVQIQSLAYKIAESVADWLGLSTNVKIPKEYVVVKGDTLWSIAIKNKTTVDELVRLNGLNNANLIYPNQKLKLP